MKYTLSKEEPDCREGVRDSHFLDISMSVPSGSHRVSIHSVVSAHVPRACLVSSWLKKQFTRKNIANGSGARVLTDAPTSREVCQSTAEELSAAARQVDAHDAHNATLMVRID